MENRLNKQLNDLDYPTWLEENKNALIKLYDSFKDEADSSIEFQGFTIGMYIETSHAANRINRRN
jgi:hypothetical protein